MRPDSELERWKSEPYPRYQEEINESIRFAGLTVDFFTEGKARHLMRLMRRRFGSSAPACLDIGCGPGTMHGYLQSAVGSLHGVDVSAEAVRAAQASHPWANYGVFEGGRLPFGDASFDVVFASCVLHHVARNERPGFMAEAYRVLRPGGLVVLFEHNPLNPLTRLAVLRCEFDRDAVLLGRREARQLTRGAGFGGVLGRYIFFLPLRAAWARRIDDSLGGLALGAQYYVAGVRPGAA